MNDNKVRCASHAGSWYNRDSLKLKTELTHWLNEADTQGSQITNDSSSVRGIIAPHAGYRYSGPNAAHAYRHMKSVNKRIKRVFLLGPSHHVRLNGCALSMCSAYETPFFNLNIDEEIYSELKETGLFQQFPVDSDEEEHSLEMHLPYIAHVMSDITHEFTIIPIIVGCINSQSEKEIGSVLMKYLQSESNFFIISSDFCHWGSRFDYTLHDKSRGEIWQSIEHLDKMGMDLIEKIDLSGFIDYLDKYSNTICGRKPIRIFLSLIQQYKSEHCKSEDQSLTEMKFVKYDQSEKCKSLKDSSVSYASACFSIK